MFFFGIHVNVCVSCEIELSVPAPPCLAEVWLRCSSGKESEITNQPERACTNDNFTFPEAVLTHYIYTLMEHQQDIIFPLNVALSFRMSLVAFRIMTKFTKTLFWEFLFYFISGTYFLFAYLLLYLLISIQTKILHSTSKTTCYTSNCSSVTAEH